MRGFIFTLSFSIFDLPAPRSRLFSSVSLFLLPSSFHVTLEPTPCQLSVRSKAIRPLPRYAAQVAAKPYDVLNSDEARAEAAGNPLSFLHVGKPEIDLPPDVDIR